MSEEENIDTARCEEIVIRCTPEVKAEFRKIVSDVCDLKEMHLSQADVFEYLIVPTIREMTNEAVKGK